MDFADTLIKQDLSHIFHPCSQMKDYEELKPLIVKSAKGCHIELHDGKKIIDAISSWWCKSLGHGHPRLKKAMMIQLERFEHVILANTTNENIVLLSQKLAALTSTLKKVFYAGDGSSAVEVAMKMSIHSRAINHEPQRKHFIALQNGYHGETLGALSVSDLGLYKAPYQSLTFPVNFITSLPLVTGTDDPLWLDAEAHWHSIEKQLEPWADTCTALILEPILQAAGGMQIYSADLLKRLRQWTSQQGIHLIADEIMTGFGRTGKMLACEHAGIEADFVCLGKGLTSGWMPFSAVLTRDDIYAVFYDDYEKNKSFLHSHTFSGNALGAALALETMSIMEDEQICVSAMRLGEWMREAMLEIADQTQRLKNVRQIGAVVAADLVSDNLERRAGFEVYQEAIELGALLRPLGNTIYWVPPLNMNRDTVEHLKQITLKATSKVSRKLYPSPAASRRPLPQGER